MTATQTGAAQAPEQATPVLRVQDLEVAYRRES
jgi:hypothetical protein